MLKKIFFVVLWLCVLTWALWLGGQSFNAVVVIPEWSADVPASLTGWEGLGPGAFFAPVGTLRLLTTLAAVLIGWWAVPPLRRWLLALAVLLVVVDALLFGYCIPRAYRLFTTMGQGMAPTEAARLAREFVVGNWVRLVFDFLGFVVAVQALVLARSHLRPARPS